MKSVWLSVVIVVCMGWAASAWSTPRDYCEAYARDFADAGPRDEEIKSERYVNALSDCLFQYQPARTAVAKSTPPKDEVPDVVKPRGGAKTKSAAKSVAKSVAKAADPEIVEELPEPAVIVLPDIAPPVRSAKSSPATAAEPKKTLFAKLFARKPDVLVAPQKPVVGSATWLDYCAKKYASFNRATGTYTSFKGVERKCLVTD